jgi:hypothetical protein
VICTGNPRVFSGIPVPVPGIYPYPLCGYGYSHGSTRSDPRVHLDLYPSRVTCRFTTIYFVYIIIKIKLQKKVEN